MNQFLNISHSRGHFALDYIFYYTKVFTNLIYFYIICNHVHFYLLISTIQIWILFHIEYTLNLKCPKITKIKLLVIIDFFACVSFWTLTEMCISYRAFGSKFVDFWKGLRKLPLFYLLVKKTCLYYLLNLIKTHVL